MRDSRKRYLSRNCEYWLAHGFQRFRHIPVTFNHVGKAVSKCIKPASRQYNLSARVLQQRAVGKALILGTEETKNLGMLYLFL